jgi:hypothetical protein
MKTAEPNRIVRFLPSPTDAAFLVPLLFLFLRLSSGSHMLADGDTGWHLRTGEWILQNGRVPDKDIFSFTKAGEPWFAWEWLWDVTFGWLHLHAGMAAVLAASMLALCCTYAILFRLVRRNCPNVLYLRTKVFIDGRSDFYGEAFAKKYTSFINAQYGWEQTLAAYGVDDVLLPVNTPLIGAFRESQRWRPAYDDGMAIVFRSAESLARATAGEDVTASASAGVTPADGNQRGREITKSNQRDRRITQPNTRSE